MTDCILEAINSNIQLSISALTRRQCPSISHDSFARICLCHDAPRPLRPDKLRPVTASLSNGGRWITRWQLSKNIRCFSNAPRLSSSAWSSDSAISERWPVSSAYLTITRWRTIYDLDFQFGDMPVGLGKMLLSATHGFAGSPPGRPHLLLGGSLGDMGAGGPVYRGGGG